MESTAELPLPPHPEHLRLPPQTELDRKPEDKETCWWRLQKSSPGGTEQGVQRGSMDLKLPKAAIQPIYLPDMLLSILPCHCPSEKHVAPTKGTHKIHHRCHCALTLIWAYTYKTQTVVTTSFSHIKYWDQRRQVTAQNTHAAVLPLAAGHGACIGDATLSSQLLCGPTFSWWCCPLHSAIKVHMFCKYDYFMILGLYSYCSVIKSLDSLSIPSKYINYACIRRLLHQC